MTGSKHDIAALELARQLGIKWDTAWLIKQKLMEAIRQRNSIYKLAGDIQIDDACDGGEKPGKRGRGAANKTPFVIADQTRDGRPIYTQMRPVAAFTKEAIKTYALRSIEPGSRVLSDGLGCFRGIDEAGLKHVVKVTGGARPEDADFKWVNTGLGNVKSAMTGTPTLVRSPARSALSGRLRVALQSPLRPQGTSRTSGSRRRDDPAPTTQNGSSPSNRLRRTSRRNKASHSRLAALTAKDMFLLISAVWPICPICSYLRQ